MVYVVDWTRPRNRLEETMAGARQAMERRGCRFYTVYEATRYWRHLARFAVERGAEEFSPGLATAWLAEREAQHPGEHANRSGAKRAMRILTQYHLNGCWDLHPRRMNVPVAANSPFLGDMKRFLGYLESERGVARNTLLYGNRLLRRWLAFLADKGITAWPQLCGAVFSDFLASNGHMAPGSLALVAGVLRWFMRYLFVQGVVDRDWSERVPRFRRARPERLPSIWTPEEVEALLASVDRASAVGKRDYAVLLLACRLGMRAGDIRALRLENLCWESAQIEFEQAKTGKKVTLPLSEEVGQALIDYLRHGRPVSQSREVFLRHQAPYEALGWDNRLNGIITKHRRRAGIRPLPERARGMHSLRHTVATRMLGAGVPLETIADVLGHASLDTTRIYARVDVAALRQVALDIEEVHHVSQP
jgi:integrase